MMTMEELLDSLIKKAALECEEAHRQVVAALNGLAALHIIAQQVSCHTSNSNTHYCTEVYVMSP